MPSPSRHSACRKSARGNALIEFTLLGIPIIFITISIVCVSLDMWQYHNLAYATDLTARRITLHGATCSANGNSCTITVASVASYFASQALALDQSQVNITLTDGSGPTTCIVGITCSSNLAQFPGASYNSVGSDVTVKATYILKDPLAMYWPPNRDAASDFTVAATSRQRIIF